MLNAALMILHSKMKHQVICKVMYFRHDDHKLQKHCTVNSILSSSVTLSSFLELTMPDDKALALDSPKCLLSLNLSCLFLPCL